jgi:hypothetical protein
MRVGTVYYNENTDETTIKWSDVFTEQDWLLRADVAKDLMHLTQQKYDSLIDNMSLYEGSK